MLLELSLLQGVLMLKGRRGAGAKVTVPKADDEWAAPHVRPPRLTRAWPGPSMCLDERGFNFAHFPIPSILFLSFFLLLLFFFFFLLLLFFFFFFSRSRCMIDIASTRCIHCHYVFNLAYLCLMSFD